MKTMKILETFAAWVVFLILIIGFSVCLVVGINFIFTGKYF